MTKTLNQFLEGYLKVKSSDEQKFIDKHVAVKNPDRNGNGDDVFNGNTKTINRRKTRKGYDAGDDAKVYEEAEQIDELSKKTLGSYVKKASVNARNTAVSASHQSPLVKKNATIKDMEDSTRDFKRSDNRISGITKAVGKLTKEEADLEEKAPPGAKYERMVKDIKKGYAKGGVTAREKSIAYATAWKAKKANEEAEQIDELSKDTLVSYALKAHSKGDMASRMSKSGADKSMANYANKRYQGVRTAIKKLANEEAEQIDELSKKTMGRYINKAKDVIDITSWRQGHREASNGNPSGRLEKKLTKRHKGIETAVKKLTKEEAEQIDELSKKTLGSYVKKGIDSAADHNAVGDSYNRIAKKSIMKPRADAKSMADFHNDKANTRTKYVKKAVNKLAKEETLVDILSGLKESHIRTMVEVYESLSEENQAKFVATCKKDGGIDAMLNFAIKNRGE